MTVRNKGIGPSESGGVYFYRSRYPRIGRGPGTIKVGSVEVDGLPASGTVTVSKELNGPPDNDVHYYFALVGAVAGESNVNNNFSSVFAVKALGSPPDLVVVSPYVRDNTGRSEETSPGEPIAMNATVRNQGTGGAYPTTLRYYRSSDATISTSDTPIGTDAVDDLSVSGSSSKWYSGYAPLSAGTYYYGACVDPVLEESDTTNNCSLAGHLTVQPPGPPDLVVRSPSVSNSTPGAGETFKFVGYVANVGTGTSSPTTLRYYRSSDATISTDDAPVGTDKVMPWRPTEGGGEAIELTAPSSVGTYYYGACVDPSAGEVVTDNNCSSGVPVTVH